MKTPKTTGTTKRTTKRAGPRRLLASAALAGALAFAPAGDAARDTARGAVGADEEPLGRPGRPVLLQPGLAPPPAPQPARPARGPSRESLEPLERCLAQAADTSAADVERCAKAGAERSTR